MSKILDIWGSLLNEQALLLLQSAEDIANTQGIETNILHIWFVALTNSKLAIRGQIVNNLNIDSLRQLIEDVQDKMRKEIFYLGLEMYQLACLDLAQREHIQISAVLILSQILEKSYTVEQLMLAHQVPTLELRKLLAANIEAGKTYSSTSKGYTQSTINQEDHADIMHLVADISATAARLDAARLEYIDSALYSVTLNTLLGHLERQMQDKIIIIIGQNGSVINVLDLLLAYHLELTTRQQEVNVSLERLKGYKLWRISLNHLRDLYNRKRYLYPARVLDYLKNESIKAHAVLLIIGLETCTKRNAQDRKLKEQLARPQGANIIGCYFYYEKHPDRNEWLLSLDNAILAEPEKLNDKDKLQPLLKKYLYPCWERQGYILDDDAMDSLFILEPGIWIDKQRKTFPYLAIDLIEDCIFTFGRGEQQICNLVGDARIALRNLLTQEALHTDEDTRIKFTAALEAATARIEGLWTSPAPQQRGGKKVITQAMLEAQLFCRNNSEFHFPGLFPWSDLSNEK
ncbi:hypothetical protein EPA93_22740 [Ktedonosporobacter rubrisoli]|uniref:Uncharacterized protein n=1 Tax=Ktedonosporobacter rubrisoli TaxID=2509675 RepID=A0A4P6JTP7_KTERU|nr:hypothetical protein [Ktedonosporobacter rubrisoli]QBD78652.1 hypothetical protein EPA93_22740 [Ktedonosporobacter rubrisoli]